MSSSNNISRIIITDTHFGKKNNSATFLKSQMSFFDELINKIHSLPLGSRVDLIHTGDLFDSRSSVNIYVLGRVMEMMNNLMDTLREINPMNKIVLIAGNHDFFSPIGDTVNSLDTIISPVFKDNVLIVSKSEVIDPDDPSVMYVPWFRWNEHMDELDFQGINTVFTHTDLHEWCRDERIPFSTVILSGHIHQMRMYRRGNMVNIPAPYCLDFSDVNDDNRGAFWYDASKDKDKLSLWLENQTSIKFRKLVDEQIFNIPDIDDSMERGDNYNIYLSPKYRNNEHVSERINELRESFRYINIIPVSDVVENGGEYEIPKVLDALNIEDILKNTLPDTLQSLFDIVIKNVHTQKNNI